MKQKKGEIPSSNLSSDTKGQPVVLLPPYNWIHCELSWNVLLPVCICINGPSTEPRKLMQNTEAKGGTERVGGGCKPAPSVPGGVHVAGPRDVGFFCFVFCAPIKTDMR